MSRMNKLPEIDDVPKRKRASRPASARPAVSRPAAAGPGANRSGATSSSLREPMDPEQKRMIIITVAFAVVCALVGAGIYLMNRSDEEATTPVVASMPLDEADRETIEGSLNEFITNAGRWGVRDDVFTAKNAISVRSAINSGSALAESFWQPRSAAYSTVADAFLSNPSPVYYDTSGVEAWNDEVEEEALASFRSTSADVTVPTTRTSTSFQGKAVPLVDVPFTLVSELTTRTQTSNDSSWDGTFEVARKSFRDPWKASFIQVDGEWKLYNISGPRPYLLATWGDPEQQVNDGSYYAALSGGEIVEEIKVVLPR